MIQKRLLYNNDGSLDYELKLAPFECALECGVFCPKTIRYNIINHQACNQGYTYAL